MNPNRLLIRECLLLLSIILSFYFPGNAQQPGGVSGTRAWYVSGADGRSLIDSSGYKLPAYTVPGSPRRTFNFHPAVKVPANGLRKTHQNFSFGQGTVIGIFYPGGTNSNDTFLQVKYDTLQVSAFNNKYKRNSGQIRYEYAYGNRNLRTTLELLFPTRLENAMKTAVFHSAIARNPLSIWGENKTTSFIQHYEGYLPELIVYNRVLSPREIWKVQSYLAIKYGITLDTSYITSKGAVIWDVNNKEISKFHHRVCVIAKDTKAALIQPKSNTSYEEGYISFSNSSSFIADQLTGDNNTIIPLKDSPSVFRSLTVGFMDINAVPEETYLAWGDDNSNISTEALTFLDKPNHIQVISRVWLLNNPAVSKVPLRIVLAGQTYQKRQTIFEKIYRPYDYQFYRYLLIKLNSANVRDTAGFILNSYFGREQSNRPTAENFNTRFLVWDSVLTASRSPLNYFTFGRVPLLSFWEVIKTRKDKFTKIKLDYVYDRNLPLRAETVFDTAVTDFKAGDSIQLKLSLGVNPVTIRYKEDVPGSPWRSLTDAAGAATFETAEDSVAVVTPPGAQSTDTTIIEQSKEKIQGDLRYINKQPWKKELPFKYVKLGKLNPNATYIIEAIDRLGQRSILTLRLKP